MYIASSSVRITFYVYYMLLCSLHDSKTKLFTCAYILQVRSTVLHGNNLFSGGDKRVYCSDVRSGKKMHQVSNT